MASSETTSKLSRLNCKTHVDGGICRDELKVLLVDESLFATVHLKAALGTETKLLTSCDPDAAWMHLQIFSESSGTNVTLRGWNWDWIFFFFLVFIERSSFALSAVCSAAAQVFVVAWSRAGAPFPIAAAVRSDSLTYSMNSLRILLRLFLLL